MTQIQKNSFYIHVIRVIMKVKNVTHVVVGKKADDTLLALLLLTM